jgi:DNA helicase-2/ATP-dependent DNA helicase PcrA
VNIAEFEKRYKSLNAGQKQAVDTLEGPVMVIAGPGTGKTRTLTLRIANIVRLTDTEPENILALTFTEAGVVSMRKALAEVMGADAYAVNISTFHGFSNGVIKDYPECFPRIIGSEPITDSEKIKIFEGVIESLPLKRLRPSGDKFYYLRDISGAISDLKREGVDTADYKEIVAKWRESFESIEDLYHSSGKYKGAMKGKYADEQKNIEKNEDLTLIYEAYERALSEARVYDYEDMIMETLKALRSDKNLLLSLQEKYQYILADEHQDSNKAQNRILELLANFHKNPNIFIVGDSKQAIFRFQGASLDNFYYFKNIYPEAKLITLVENYRSTEEILAGAYSLMPKDEELKSKEGKGEKIRVMELATELAEEYFLVDDIKEKIDKGAKPGEIAVLYRENKNGLSIASVFEKYGIPFVIESDNNLLADRDVRKIIKIMKAVADFDDQFSLAEAMHVSSFGIAPIDVYKTLDEARASRTHIMEAIEKSHIEQVKEFGKKISAWKTISKNEGLMETADAIIADSGILKSLINQPDALARIDRISAFYGHIRDFAGRRKGTSFDDFISHLMTMEEYGISITAKKGVIAEDKVRLMTAHRSKGQEFGIVYIIRAIDGLWGNKRRPEKLRLPYAVYSLSGREIEDDEKQDDERKLFYVALTRAKKELTITYSREGVDNREQLPTEFIGEIKAEMLERENTDKWDKGTSEHITKVFLNERPKLDQREETEKLVKKTLEEKGLSATDINNYLSCPWKYFYTGLFRIPEKKERHLIYGTAVHASLKDLFDSIKEHGARKDYLLTRFEYHLSSEPLKETDYKELLERGKTALGTYFEERKNEWERDFLTEFYIAGVEVAPGITIKGRIDRMELKGFSHDVVVTDYKTGKAKSEREIAGETKNSDGNIKRQLVFYKLLVDGYKNGKYKMVSGQVDFVEPDDKGRCKKYEFPVTQEEADDLKSEVIRIAEEIRTLKFWDTRCNDKDCPYCSLREE